MKGSRTTTPSEQLTQAPFDVPESETPVTEFDTLSLFLPEEAFSASARACGRTTESREAASRQVPAVDAPDRRAAPQMDMKRLDDFCRLLGQTQILLERLKSDADALRVELSERRSPADDLGRDYTRPGVERVIESVGKQLQTLTESARNAVNGLRSQAARSPAWKIGRRFLIWAPVPGALVALQLLGVITVGTRVQPAQIATIAPAARRESPVSEPVSLPPSRTSRPAMFVRPVSLAAGPTRTTPVNDVSSADRPDPTPATRAKNAAGVSRPDGSAKETAQYVGILAVDSEPTGSVVFVDRQQVGETPLRLTGLRAGSHVVRIERDGYDRWTTAALVAADTQTHVRAKLQAVRDR